MSIDPDLKKKMLEAAKNGSLGTLQAIINSKKQDERKLLLNNSVEREFTVLHAAAYYNHPEIIQWLLSSEKGGGRAAGFESVVVRAICGETALHFAVQQGHLECCKTIVNGCRTDNGERQQMMNIVDSNGWTVLHVAAMCNRPEIIRWLLSGEGGRAAGFNSYLAGNHDRITALHLAARGGHAQCCKAIAKGCRADNGERQEILNTEDTFARTALHYAVQHGRVTVVAWLLSSGKQGGRAAGFNRVLAGTPDEATALHLAAENGHFECCKAIVNGCRVDNGERQQMLNAVNYGGWTLLHYAVSSGRTEIITWLLTDEDEGGVAAGFDRSLVTASTTMNRISCLHLAVRSGRGAVRELLTNCTAKQRMNLFLCVDNKGWTALHYAVRSYGGNFLLQELPRYPECQYSANLKDHSGLTALHRAIIGGLDDKGRGEWSTGFAKPQIITALLATTMIDPNIGIGL